jgi:uncharacterized damage-inducible protein DinB
MNSPVSAPEPWLRGTLTDVPAVPRAVLHALELAKEDLHRWCMNLSNAQLNAVHANLPSVAFQLRHIACSMDRLLTYAEGKQLSAAQMSALQTESAPDVGGAEVFAELDATLDAAAARVRAFSSADLEQPRGVGKRQLPTSVAGLLVHVADHHSTPCWTGDHHGQAGDCDGEIEETRRMGSPGITLAVAY